MINEKVYWAFKALMNGGGSAELTMTVPEASELLSGHVRPRCEAMRRSFTLDDLGQDKWRLTISEPVKGRPAGPMRAAIEAMQPGQSEVHQTPDAHAIGRLRSTATAVGNITGRKFKVAGNLKAGSTTITRIQ